MKMQIVQLDILSVKGQAVVRNEKNKKKKGKQIYIVCTIDETIH